MKGEAIRERKCVMEKTIADLLNQFQRDTGLVITSIALDYSRGLDNTVADVQLTMGLE